MKKFVYVDASASWLKPQSVVETETDFLVKSYANAGRGICERAEKVDALVNESRRTVADFIGADEKNIIFTSGATDALNRIVDIVKNTFINKNLVVAVSDLDHHSARLPWMALEKQGGCRTVLIPLDKNFNLDFDNIPFADVFVITAMSNVLGYSQDVVRFINTVRAKNPNAITVVDASQYVAHEKIDVKKFDCDFLVFSGHKIGADTGVGVMYIKNPDLFDCDKFGGGMVNRVLGDGNLILNKSPEKFEAGTLPITQIVGLRVAIKELQQWDGGQDIIDYMYNELSKIEHVKILSVKGACILSFVVHDMHVLDFGVMMGARDICLRVGNMCASWIHKKLGVDGSIRISVGPWNTMEDAKYIIDNIKKVVG
ncbi:MAG: aminotransferase class V-fold PLP-dependent enzyme [Alphaproteobacteria bacterium]|nr:aminotransferase class V-fold PLP-dependent enzyme [Alphaproteobacteria bacterium]